MRDAMGGWQPWVEQKTFRHHRTAKVNKETRDIGERYMIVVKQPYEGNMGYIPYCILVSVIQFFCVLIAKG